MMKLAKTVPLILVAVVLQVGSSFAADYYPFRDVADPAATIEAVSQKCEENPSPELLTALAWLLHVYRNDNQRAEELFGRALAAQPDNCWARYGLCIVNEMKGDFQGVLSNALALCQTSPEHPLALLALLNVRELFGRVGNFNTPVKAVLAPLLEGERSRSIQFDEMCREVLSAISRYEGNLDGVKSIVRDGGYVTEWRIAGPFGEYPSVSFLSAWQPQSDSVLGRAYKRGDRFVKPKRYSSEYGAISPSWVTQGVYYAETFLRSASAQEVVLKVSSRSAIEISLNNHRIYVKDAIRSYCAVTEYVRARLSPGYNRLLVKFLAGGGLFINDVAYKSLNSGCVVAESFGGPTIQVFDAPYGGASVSVSGSPQRWRRVKEVEHSIIDPDAFAYFSGLVRENPNDPLALGICGMLKTADGDVHAAKRFLTAAVRRAPSYWYFHYVLGRVSNDDISLPVQVRRSESRARFSLAIAGVKDFPLALFGLAFLDIHEEKELQAVEKLNECVASSPGFFLWHDTLYRIYRQKKWRREQVRELEKISALGLDSCAPYHLAEEYYRATKQYDKLSETIEKLQRTHVNPDFVARHSFESGEDQTAISEYLKLRVAEPEDEGVRSSLVELYERNARWVDAEKEVKAALKLFPENLGLWKRLAELKGYTGRGWQERQIWGRVLRRNPVDPDARRALKAYGRKDTLDEYDIPSTVYLHDPAIRQKYAGVSSVILIDQTVEEIYPDSSSRQKVHNLVLLNDRKAIDRWGELSVPEEELLELRTIKSDGSVVEPEPPEKSKTTFSMGGLQEGDMIEFKYVTSSSASPSRPRRHLGQRFFFQTIEIPMDVSQYVVIVPEELKLKYEQVNFSKPPSITRNNGKKVYKWEARNMPAVPREPLVAAEAEFLSFVRVGVNFDETAEVLEHEDHDISMTRLSEGIEETVARLLADCPGDVESRARAIHSFVSREIRGGGGSANFVRAASETLADRNGDRLALAKAMLDVAEIRSDVLAVRGKLMHASKVFPGSFDSALLAIKDGEGRYVHFLDFGSRYLPFGYIRSSLQGGGAIALQHFSSPDFGLGQNDRKRVRQRLSVPRLSVEANCEMSVLNSSVRGDGAIECTQVI